MLTLRAATAVLAAGLLLAACGGDDPGADAPALPTSTPGAALPTPTASAAPDVAAPLPTGDRTVEQLTAQVAFTAPEETDPVVAEAVQGYREFVEAFVVAQGLPDRDHPPLLERLDAALVERALASARENIDAGFLTLGPYGETVVEAAGDVRGVFMTTCTDSSERTIYDADTGELAAEVTTGVVGNRLTLVKPAQVWVVRSFERADDVECP